MKVSELIRDLPISPAHHEFEVAGLTHDSRRVSRGDLFIALTGQHFDGRRFAGEALRRGAVGILAQGPRPNGLEGPWLEVEDPRKWVGPLSARLYGHPDRELTTVGVTGTNGKSTVTRLVAAMVNAAGKPCVAIGTLGTDFRGQAQHAELTTPEAPDLFAALRRSRSRGAMAAVIEVSSHGLELHRVRGMQFDLAVFTNLSRDHLDFHRDLEAYFAAKRSLFSSLKVDGRAVVNIDDAYGRRLAGELGHAMTFGKAGRVRAVAVELDRYGQRLTFAVPSGRFKAVSSLLGRFNTENLTAAVAAAEVLGLSHEAIAEGISAVGPLPGRMEPVDCGQPFPVFIDYAHTDRALAAALASLAELARHRIVVVFGCGGDRDPGKREAMGRVAGELADLVILTSDNPRSEDPLAIIAAVEKGLLGSGSRDYLVIADRREAIARAIAVADEGWAVLVAGKGHEQVQIGRQGSVPFSDRLEIERALEERFGSRNDG